MRRWMRSLRKALAGRPRTAKLRSYRLALEPLEDRQVLSADYLQTNLVSDIPGMAQVLDKNLVNPWGLVASPTSPFWVSDNNAGLSTLYTGQGQKLPLEVHIPAPGDPAGSSGTPTGTVFNTTLATKTPGFTVSDGTHSGPAIFLFDTEDGTVLGWNPGVDPTGQFDGPGHASTHAVIAVDNSANPTAADGAVYKGLTIGKDLAGDTLLYAANFRSGHIDVFGQNFNPVNLPGGFADTSIPDGFAPFNIQAINGNFYVTYAKQNATKHDDVAGQGNGFVDVFNGDGVLQQHLIRCGQLDSPWGVAIAPANFGGLSGDLLVGNFGNGHINAFDPSNGHFIGAMQDATDHTVVIDDLWALRFGNGAIGGAHATLAPADVDRVAPVERRPALRAG